MVLKAAAVDEHGLNAKYVAVKTLKDGATEKEREDYLSEAELLATFKHPNVLGLVGTCIHNEPYLIIIEVENMKIKTADCLCD